MSKRVPPPRQEPSLSRRQFLGGAARAAAGTMLAPALLLSAAGCRKAVLPGPAGEAETHTLRVTSFQGAPDGRERTIWGYNGQLPGPPLRVKEGETLRVKVINQPSVPTSIHWHGMHQPGTWRMDGVEGASGPPITPGAEFVYEYRATPAGTHWYHSHVGVQYGDGLFGPLLVEENPPTAGKARAEIPCPTTWSL